MPLLLFLGDNSLELEEAVRDMRRPFNPADVLVYEGSTVPLAELSAACRTAGLFDPERLIIIHALQERLKNGRKGDVDGESVTELLASVAPTTTLLLLSPEMPGDHDLVARVRSAGGEVRSFVTPKKRDLPRWIVTRARAQGVTIEHEAADLLAQLVGANTVMLDSELEKLATYADDDPITPRTVDMLVGQVTQESIFALVDAIAAGDKAGAFRLLHAQIDQAASTSTDFALYLIRMVSRQMRILLGIRLGQRAGKSQSTLIAELRLPRYFSDRYFRQAKRLSQERLIASFEQLASLEHDLKTGKADPGPGLDILLADLCA